MTKIIRGPVEPLMTYKARVNKEKMMQEVIECESIEDLKILLLCWIDNGDIHRRERAPWDRN